jgi:phosphotransacetylase
MKIREGKGPAIPVHAPGTIPTYAAKIRAATPERQVVLTEVEAEAQRKAVIEVTRQQLVKIFFVFANRADIFDEALRHARVADDLSVENAEEIYRYAQAAVKRDRSAVMTVEGAQNM